MNQTPEAIFIVERRPGQGYGVTSSQGPRAQALQRSAVEILDRLGQPDPRGPEEIQRWVPNAGPDQQSLFVRIHRTPEGESIYHQAWFPASPPPAPSAGPAWWPHLGIAALLLILGGLFGWFWRGPSPGAVTPDASSAVAPPVPGTSTPRTDPPTVSRSEAALHLPVRKSREARQKLAEFLTQPGLTGWPEDADTIERTVEVRDFRKTPRGVRIEPIYLTSDEVRNLRSLLAALETLP